MSTTDKNEITEEFLNKGHVETDVFVQRRKQREEELTNWDKEQARNMASHDGIELTDDHFKVIDLLRNYYLKNGAVKSGRELGDMLDDEFTHQGGRKFLRELFPQGPVTQGMRFAGLAVPAHSEDQSFGTSR